MAGEWAASCSMICWNGSAALRPAVLFVYRHRLQCRFLYASRPDAQREEKVEWDDGRLRPFFYLEEGNGIGRPPYEACEPDAHRLTMSAPNGQSASFAILNDWMPNGMPIIVMQFSRPAPRN